MSYEEVEVRPALPLAPWRTMWLYPRATIRAILNSDNPDAIQSISRLAILLGVSQVLSPNTTPALLFLYFRFALSDNVLVTLALVALFGPVLGLVGITVSGIVYGAIGRRFGGVATNEETRAALVWGSLPTIAGLPLALLLVIIESLGWLESTSATVLLYLFAALSIWAIVLTVATLAEVNRVSLLRAFGILIVPILAIIVLGLLFIGIGLVMALLR